MEKHYAAIIKRNCGKHHFILLASILYIKNTSVKTNYSF